MRSIWPFTRPCNLCIVCNRMIFFSYIGEQLSTNVSSDKPLECPIFGSFHHQKSSRLLTIVSSALGHIQIRPRITGVSGVN